MLTGRNRKNIMNGKFLKKALIVAIIGIPTMYLFSKVLSSRQTPNNNMKNQINVPQASSEQTSPITTNNNDVKKYSATLKTTKGDIVIELNSEQTPLTVNNFITLSKNGFYNGTIFHRVISGFMIQGGDPNGDGTGGPGYTFEDEPFTGDYVRGAVAMANSGPNTNGSQFFIMHQDYALAKNYTIFGHVTQGMDIVDAIATDQVMQGPTGEMSKPVSPTSIISVEITQLN